MTELFRVLVIVAAVAGTFATGLTIGKHYGHEAAWRDYTLSATIDGMGEFHPISGEFHWFPCMWVDE